jgi:hypothetical protein
VTDAKDEPPTDEAEAYADWAAARSSSRVAPDFSAAFLAAASPEEVRYFFRLSYDQSSKVQAVQPDAALCAFLRTRARSSSIFDLCGTGIPRASR